MKINKSIHHQLAIAGFSAVFTAATVFAIEPDYVGPPAADDPSAFTGPIVSEERSADLVDLIPAMEGALEIKDGKHVDPGLNNSLTNGIQAEGIGANARRSSSCTS